MFLPLHDRNPIGHIRFPYVNYTLIGITIVVFAIQSILPQSGFDALTVQFGTIPAVLNDTVAPPTTWLPKEATLFTYAFLHVDWMHLLSNMLFLWIFGDNIEDALGHVRYLIFYFLCSVFAAYAHIWMNGDSFGPLIGASGAVAGVMGAYVLLFPHARLFVLWMVAIPIPLPIPAFWMLGFWIASQLFYAFVSADDPIAWWAHLGGFAAGVVLAAIMKRRGVKFFGGR